MSNPETHKEECTCGSCAMRSEFVAVLTGKYPITLYLTGKENRILGQLAKEKDLSPERVLKLALAQYQLKQKLEKERPRYPY